MLHVMSTILIYVYVVAKNVSDSVDGDYSATLS